MSCFPGWWGYSFLYLHMDPSPVAGEEFWFATRIYAISYPRWISWLNFFPFRTREIQLMSVAFTCVLVMTSQYINITRRSSCVELLSTFCCTTTDSIMLLIYQCCLFQIFVHLLGTFMKYLSIALMDLFVYSGGWIMVGASLPTTIGILFPTLPSALECHIGAWSRLYHQQAHFSLRQFQQALNNPIHWWWIKR